MANNAPLLLDAGRVSATARDFCPSASNPTAFTCTALGRVHGRAVVRRWPACLKPPSLHCESPLSGTARTIGRSGDRPPTVLRKARSRSATLWVGARTRAQERETTIRQSVMIDMCLSAKTSTVVCLHVGLGRRLFGTARWMQYGSSLSSKSQQQQQ